MIAWWITLLIQVGITLLYDLVKPKPEFDSPDPAGLSDFKFPTIGEGRVIPIIYGTVKLTGPMVTWYGNLYVAAIKKWVKTGIFTGEHVTVGYLYYLTMQLVFCSGEIDGVVDLYFDDRRLRETTGDAEDGWTPHVTTYGTRCNVIARKFYGGTDEEGGIEGHIRVHHGRFDDEPDAVLDATIAGDIPAWRGLCYAVFGGGLIGGRFYVGTSPYIKDFAIALERYPNTLGLSDGDENIDGDANPAAMIFDLMTQPRGKNGLGIPIGNVDVTRFREIGETLAEEELGLSMIIETAAAAKDVILDILRHIDAVMFIEPTTGLFTIELVRPDYDVEELPVLDESNCEVLSFGRSSWGEIKNEVRVQYIDREDGYIVKTVQAQDLAALEASGGEISTQMLSLRGFSNATNAQHAAARALKGLCYPLASLHMRGTREHWTFRPGTPFVLNWPRYGIAGLVARVSKIGKGELISGAIEFDALEDVFGVGWTAYTPPGQSEWVDPESDVPALTDQEAILAPYEAVKLLPAPAGQTQAIVMAARGLEGVTKGFNAIVESESTVFNWLTPIGSLTSAVDELTSTIVVDMGPDAEFVESVNDADFNAGENVIFIADGTGPEQTGLEEFIAFKVVSMDVEDQEITLSTLARGCLDTAPTSFAADTRVWFLSYGNGVVNIEDSGATQITFQPFNNLGPYPIGSCPSVLVTPTSDLRRSRPYCPTDVRFNGDSYPESITGELTVTWEHRDRLGDWGYADSGETDEPEEDTTYTVKVYGELGTLVHTESDLTGTTWTYLEADEIAESGLGRLNNSLRVEIWTYRGSKVGLRVVSWAMTRTP